MSARVIVTGAAGGIGGAACAALRARGARVVGLDLHAGDDVIACDVRDQASVDAAVGEAIERLGGLDVLINNAGIGMPQSAGAAPADDALAVLDVNLVGPWRVTAAALPALRAARGRVDQRRVRPRARDGPVRDRVLHEQARAGGVLRRAAAGARRRVDRHHRLPRLHPHEDPRRLDAARHGARGRRAGRGRLRRRRHARPRRARAARARPGDERSGAAGYFLARRAPRRLLDAITRTRMRRLAAQGHFDRAPMAAEFRARLRSG